MKAAVISLTEASADARIFVLHHLDMMTESLLHDNTNTEWQCSWCFSHYGEQKIVIAKREKWRKEINLIRSQYTKHKNPVRIPKQKKTNPKATKHSQNQKRNVKK